MRSNGEEEREREITRTFLNVLGPGNLDDLDDGNLENVDWGEREREES